MSVLVEALTLLIQRSVLDSAYPGGADAFLLSVSEPSSPARRLCADDRLVSVSFLNPDDAEMVAAPLREFGLVEVDGTNFCDLAYVDQHFGPTMPCPWIEWERHREGFTHAWLAGTPPGDMAAPADWTPEQSRELTRHDVRDQSHMFKLAEDDGFEYWLDLNTGRQIIGTATDDDRTPVSSEYIPGVSEGRLISIALKATSEHGWVIERPSRNSLKAFVRGRDVTFMVLIIEDPVTDTIVVTSALPVFVPAERRSAIAELLSRVNWSGLLMGALELDFEDGHVRYRQAIDCEGGELTVPMMKSMIAAACHYASCVFEPIMRVAYGEVEPVLAAELFMDAVRSGSD
jgi:hypothetical protein